MFAFHIQPDGTVDYIGEVLAQRRDTLRLNVLDAVMATGCGMWCLSDEIRDVPKNECRPDAGRLGLVRRRPVLPSVLGREGRRQAAG